MRFISLTEYKAQALSQDALSEDEGLTLHRQFSEKVSVEFPSPKTEMMWRLTSQGWVGFLPVTDDLGLRLDPRVPLGNLFRMLEYAYRLQSFHVFDGLIDCASLYEFFERLANILAKRVLDRARKGLYRSYVQQSDRLPFVRGRVDVGRAVRSPSSVDLNCDFEEHTADIEDNQILGWTMGQIARSGMCSERVLPAVRQAFRVLQGAVSLVPASPAKCIRRFYHRLNDDYHPLHALCRFFLEHSGPTLETGSRRMLPFVVNMSRLFELFVAEWLESHVPATSVCKSQESVSMGQGGILKFKIDVVLYDALTGQPKCVLDTKYKTDATPSPADVAQVVTYAQLKGCREAILVYPNHGHEPLNVTIGSTRMRSLRFRIDGDLELAGRAFLADVFA